MPPPGHPLLVFLATPSIRVTLLLIAIWGAADLAYSLGLPGFRGGSVSHAVSRLYHSYPLLAEWVVIGSGVGLVLFLSSHFKSLLPGP